MRGLVPCLGGVCVCVCVCVFMVFPQSLQQNTVIESQIVNFFISDIFPSPCYITHIVEIVSVNKPIIN